jgi:hypothetical protein
VLAQSPSLDAPAARPAAPPHLPAAPAAVPTARDGGTPAVAPRAAAPKPAAVRPGDELVASARVEGLRAALPDSQMEREYGFGAVRQLFGVGHLRGRAGSSSRRGRLAMK